MTEPSHEANTTAPEDAAPTQANAEPTVAELKDRYLRLAAEFDNYRKRVQRDREEQRLRDRDELIIDWLEIVDNLERAVAARSTDAEVWLEGTQAIHRQAMTLLNKAGVRPIQPTGQPFDPHRHDAVGAVAMPGATAGHVIHTDRTGYERAERVLRPARVVVAAETE